VTADKSTTTDAQSARVPGWVRLADAIALALIGLSVWSALTGGSRTMVAGIILSTRSPLLFLYAASSLLLARHLLYWQPRAWRRWRDMVASVIRGRPELSAALSALVATRPAVFAIGFLAVIMIGPPAAMSEADAPRKLVHLPARYDAGWYITIALDGYSWDHTFQRQQNIAFFPAVPMLMRPVGAVFGMYERDAPRQRQMLRAVWAGVVISLAAFLWALYYVVRLGYELIGADRSPAAALLLAAYPFAVFYNAPYTEALFLLGATGACCHFMRREWMAASVWGLLAGLTRPNGCFLSVPLAVLACEQLGWGARGASEVVKASGVRDIVVRLATAAMPGIGMLLFTVYLYGLTGVWFAWARSHQAWGRTYHGFGPLLAGVQHLRDDSFMQIVMDNPANTLNALGVLFALALTYPVFRRLGPAFGLFVLVNLVPPLFAGGLLSMGRLTATLFPLFLALASLLPPRTVPAWTAAFGIGQGLCAILFFTWRDLY
jgi:hypothetical protein